MAFCHKARFCARFVFPLINLAQNLARNLARKFCDRTGLSLQAKLKICESWPDGQFPLLTNEIDVCCADCGKEEGGGVSLKACTSCRLVKYCNADCQRNHWSKHKKQCKRRAAELRDEALFKDPPAKEDCQICFLPMPVQIIACASLPPATISSNPINDYALANRHGLGIMATSQYITCCGKNICAGCVYSFSESGDIGMCAFCKADRTSKTNEEKIEELMKRVGANDAGAIYVLGSYYYHGQIGLQRDLKKAMDLWTRAAELGSSQGHFSLGNEYRQEGAGNLKKVKFHYEAAAMAGHEVARYLCVIWAPSR